MCQAVCLSAKQSYRLCLSLSFMFHEARVYHMSSKRISSYIDTSKINASCPILLCLAIKFYSINVIAYFRHISDNFRYNNSFLDIILDVIITSVVIIK